MFHILVVDDDKNTRLLMEAVLQAEGYTVSCAVNGADALDVMDRQHIDLVVLDIMMPEMDGYEFTKALREADNNLPILMVSAKQLPQDRKQGFLVGTDTVKLSAALIISKVCRWGRTSTVITGFLHI